MELMRKLESKACDRCPTIVFPEPEDDRIMEAAVEVAGRGIATPVLLWEDEDAVGTTPSGAEGMICGDEALMDKYAEAYAESRGTGEKVARRLLRRPLVYAGMMVACGDVGGMVAGIANPTASVLQAAGLTIGYREGFDSPSSCFIMLVSQRGREEKRPVIFADCAVTIEPDASQLADIATASARSARQFLDITPRVAMLSFSTSGSASHDSVQMVREAAEKAGDELEDGYVEGELQLDAAVNREIAQKKGVGDGEVAGQANVLVFPDLNSGNICYKAVQEFGGARAIGPVLQGFSRPVNDLSRGASVEDVIDTTIITALQV
ncbi:MAG: phosphotransacetylase [Planctomycetota bacterium]